MHDLMHDVAQEVAGKEIVVANSTTGSLDQRVQFRRIYFEGNPSDCANRFISTAQIRTYLQGGNSWGFQFPLSMQLKKWMNLRALHLRLTKLESLPNDIGKLLHLRYLDVSESGLEMPPESLTKLVNLQTLHLNGLDKLRELPRDLARLVKLRVLGIAHYRSLNYMPDNMNRMTDLNTLPMCVVAKDDSSMKQQLEDLGAFNKLKRSLEIRIDKKFVHKKEINSKGGGYISNKKHLNHIEIMWLCDDEDENESANEEGGTDNAEDLLEDLQPHNNLKWLRIWQYKGTKIPRWGIKNNLTTCLPNLVYICISRCSGLQSLAWPGKLQFLKSLEVRDSGNIKYIEDRIFGWSDSSTSSHGAAIEVTQQESSLFFPSLESLCSWMLPKVKGWWRGFSTSGLVMEDDEIAACKLWRRIRRGRGYAMETLGQCLRFLTLGKLPKVDDLPKGMCYLTALQSLKIDCCLLKDLPEWIGCLSSLQSLRIEYCEHLKLLLKALRKLTSLQQLELYGCNRIIEKRCQNPNGED
ncbi:hypothetical protein Cgig2_008587 [Carnegiea gigantea]|uniref:Disease resistance R13L4/SHOC-2-like LRR domain-containing protein n=1 Tax=Carnegiea gigantea TaxID=171969 RepID=A0A9Q1GST8_9CARY|nr:hypothetical protein Cgig2_008587 [Carnegiea gigantea]